MSKVCKNGIRLDALLDMPAGTVIDPIPADRRGDYFLRGASLGRLALHLIRGLDRVNPNDDLYMHVGMGSGDEGYEVAAGFARQMSERTWPDHFTAEDRDLLSEYGGRTVCDSPAIILGLPRRDYGRHLVRHPDSYDWAIAEVVRFRDIDSYSQAAISQLFEVDLSQIGRPDGRLQPS